MSKEKYTCLECGQEVIRQDGIDVRYPDDWLLECPDCDNWEQVGNNKPTCFKSEFK